MTDSLNDILTDLGTLSKCEFYTLCKCPYRTPAYWKHQRNLKSAIVSIETEGVTSESIDMLKISLEYITKHCDAHSTGHFKVQLLLLRVSNFLQHLRTVAA